VYRTVDPAAAADAVDRQSEWTLRLTVFAVLPDPWPTRFDTWTYEENA
jgi:hypothetical protein